MSIVEYLDKMKSIQAGFLKFIEKDENIENNFLNLCMILEEQKIRENKCTLTLFLHHIANVCANHYHDNQFLCKIERVLQIFKDDIKKFYTNSVIFNIFKKNKRILLFLIEEKILIFDEYVAKSIIKPKYVKKKYPQYFAPEIKTFTDKKWFPKDDEWVEEIKKDFPNHFSELRKIDENDYFDHLYQLIKKDDIENFITYVNKNGISIQAMIKNSIFETNSFLLKHNETSLIELSAFFGSNQIFKYCLINKSNVTQEIWLYAIHGQNPEIIHLLEENSIRPLDDEYKNCLKEALKCHHNDIVNYFMNNYDSNEEFVSHYSLKFYNFEYITINTNDNEIFFELCKFDYTIFVEYFIKYKNFDVNQRSYEVVFMEEEIVDTSRKYENGKVIITKTDIPYDSKMVIRKTALHIAVENENIEIIQLLLENQNINVNIKTFESFNVGRDPSDWDWCREKYWIDDHNISTEKTALYIAVERNNQDIVQMLLNHKNIDVNILSSVRTCTHEVDESNRIDITTEKTALELAVKNEKIEIIKQLLNHKNIDVNVKSLKYGIELWMGWGGGNDDIIVDKTVLHTAVKKQNIEIVKLLLAKENIDTNIKYCYRRIRYDRHGASFNDREETALFLAVERSNTEIVQLLLSNKYTDINIQSTFNNYYYNENESGFDDIYSYADKLYRTKWGLSKEDDEKDQKEEKEEEEDEEEDIDRYDKYYPIDTTYKSYRKFPKNAMTPLELARNQKDESIINLLSK